MKFHIYKTIIDEDYYILDKKRDKNYYYDVHISISEETYNHILAVEKEWGRIQDRLRCAFMRGMNERLDRGNT